MGTNKRGDMTTTRQDCANRMLERDQAEAAGMHEARIDTELPVMFTEREWSIMLTDPAFGYVCANGHRLTDADHRYGACFTCEGEAEREAYAMEDPS